MYISRTDIYLIVQKIQIFALNITKSLFFISHCSIIFNLLQIPVKLNKRLNTKRIFSRELNAILQPHCNNNALKSVTYTKIAGIRFVPGNSHEVGCGFGISRNVYVSVATYCIAGEREWMRACTRIYIYVRSM